jgi:hypothetical protein
MAFFAETTASFFQKFDNNIGFWEKRHFFRRKLAKMQKLVIITSTPEIPTYVHNVGWLWGRDRKLTWKETRVNVGQYMHMH